MSWRDRIAQAITGIRAYHGSPHDFDRFDMSKIGTGEGAQSFGHGLYFAEREETAKGYRDALKYKGSNWDDPEVLAQYWSDQFGGDRAKAIGQLEQSLAARSQQNPGNPAVRQAIGFLETDRPFSMPTPKGHMYEVNINADPSHFLDWNNQLSPEALAKVQAAAQGIKPSLYDRVTGGGADLAKWSLQPENVSELTGENALYTLKRGFGSDAAASEALREAGIPGIKYLDAGSRSAGEGSYNYVVNDDSLIDIMRKYGIAGAAPVGMGALAAQDQYGAPQQ